MTDTHFGYDKEIDLLNAMGQDVVVLNEARAYLLTGGFTPADATIRKHTIKGMDVTDLLKNLVSQVPVVSTYTPVMNSTTQQDLQARINNLQEVRLQLHEGYRWRMYQAR
jgi:hypothetical protein